MLHVRGIIDKTMLALELKTKHTKKRLLTRSNLQRKVAIRICSNNVLRILTVKDECSS